jgi:hypothetical protein
MSSKFSETGIGTEGETQREKQKENEGGATVSFLNTTFPISQNLEQK